jgi:hypothetical protein
MDYSGRRDGPVILLVMAARFFRQFPQRRRRNWSGGVRVRTAARRTLDGDGTSEGESGEDEEGEDDDDRWDDDEDEEEHGEEHEEGDD